MNSTTKMGMYNTMFPINPLTPSIEPFETNSEPDCTAEFACVKKTKRKKLFIQWMTQPGMQLP